jgi:hypothetical protein
MCCFAVAKIKAATARVLQVADLELTSRRDIYKLVTAATGLKVTSSELYKSTVKEAIDAHLQTGQLNREAAPQCLRRLIRLQVQHTAALPYNSKGRLASKAHVRLAAVSVLTNGVFV